MSFNYIVSTGNKNMSTRHKKVKKMCRFPLLIVVCRGSLSHCTFKSLNTDLRTGSILRIPTLLVNSSMMHTRRLNTFPHCRK